MDDNTDINDNITLPELESEAEHLIISRIFIFLVIYEVRLFLCAHMNVTDHIVYTGYTKPT